MTKKFNLEAAKKWAQSGDSSKPIVVSKQTRERHDSEFQPVYVGSINNPDDIKRIKKMYNNFKKKYNRK